MTETHDLDDDLRLIRDQARRILADADIERRHLAILAAETPAFHAELWRTVAEQGWPAVALPEAAGGLGLGWTALAMLAEETGRYAAPLPLAISATAAAIVAEVSPDTPVLASVADGTAIAAVALNRDAVSVSGEGADRTVHGHLPALAFGMVADHVLVTLPGHHDHDGDGALVLVDLNGPGVERTPLATIDVARAVADVRLDQAPAILLAPAGGGRLASGIAAIVAAEQLGGALACLETGCAYARERRAFGQAIGRFQGVKHALADVYVAIEIARGAVYDAVRQLNAGSPATLSAAAARLAATDAYELAARVTLHLHGGLGVSWEAGHHRHYRRARALALEHGSRFAWRDRLVDGLAKQAEARA